MKHRRYGSRGGKRSGRVIEQYPHDKYGPSFLLCGKTLPGRILHVQWGLTLPMKVITVYEPDLAEFASQDGSE